MDVEFKDAMEKLQKQTGTLYMLQTRTGKHTTPAAIKIAVDMVREILP